MKLHQNSYMILPSYLHRIYKLCIMYRLWLLYFPRYFLLEHWKIKKKWWKTEQTWWLLVVNCDPLAHRILSLQVGWPLCFLLEKKLVFPIKKKKKSSLSQTGLTCVFYSAWFPWDLSPAAAPALSGWTHRGDRCNFGYASYSCESNDIWYVSYTWEKCNVLYVPLPL